MDTVQNNISETKSALEFKLNLLQSDSFKVLC